MRVVVLVPRRNDGGRRDQLWAWVKDRWGREHPDWPVYEGHHNTGPFNRSAAINRAAKKAGAWDIAIIADSDSFVGKEQLEQAVAKCDSTGQITFAYDRWCALDQKMTDRIMNGWTGDWWPGVSITMTDTCSSMVVVTREVWDQCRGFDPGFIGWCAEDIAFAHAARTFGGGGQRVPGDMWHLFHESAPRPFANENVSRSGLYHQVAGDPEKMRALIDGLRAVKKSA